MGQGRDEDETESLKVSRSQPSKEQEEGRRLQREGAGHGGPEVGIGEEVGFFLWR